MKRVSIILALCAGILIGCSAPTQDNVQANSSDGNTQSGENIKFTRTKTNDYRIQILKDEETGLEYILVSSENGYAICPRYDNESSKYTNTIKY